MKAVIIAGGLGKRLGELTRAVPKPMIEVDGKPVLEHLIIHLKEQGISDIIICSGYLSGKIHERFGDGKGLGVRIEYAVEKELLGTGGALKNIEGKVEGTFLVVYGDLIVEMDLRKLVAYHKSKGGLGTLTVHESSHPYDSDILEVAPDGLITRFLGKPKHGQRFENISNAGVYVFEASVLKYFPTGVSMLDKSVLPSVIEKGGRLFAYSTKERVMDMGTIDRLEKCRDGG
jgi:NDP-sugar pyrophosphorylase family protein